jgi:hypothetical protein
MPSPYCGTMKAFAVLILVGTMVHEGFGQPCKPALKADIFGEQKDKSNERDLSFRPKSPGAYIIGLSVQDYCQVRDARPLTAVQSQPAAVIAVPLSCVPAFVLVPGVGSAAYLSRFRADRHEELDDHGAMHRPSPEGQLHAPVF